MFRARHLPRPARGQHDPGADERRRPYLGTAAFAAQRTLLVGGDASALDEFLALLVEH